MNTPGKLATVCIFAFFWLANLSYAQPICMTLIQGWKATQESARSYNETLSVMQDDKEVLYRKVSHSRNEAGAWTDTVTAERSALPFGLPEGRDFARDDPETFCEGATVETEGKNWLVRAPGSEGGPDKGSQLLFAPHENGFLPLQIIVEVASRALFITFEATFTTTFADWRFY